MYANAKYTIETSFLATAVCRARNVLKAHLDLAEWRRYGGEGWVEEADHVLRLHPRIRSVCSTHTQSAIEILLYRVVMLYISPRYTSYIHITN